MANPDSYVAIPKRADKGEPRYGHAKTLDVLVNILSVKGIMPQDVRIFTQYDSERGSIVPEVLYSHQLEGNKRSWIQPEEIKKAMAAAHGKQ